MATERRLIKMCDATSIYNGVAFYMAENAYLNDTALDVLKMVAVWLEDCPTVDAVEVVHGRWIDNPGVFGYECNQCGKWLVFERGNAEMNYCPNCGAKMDG